MCAQILSGIELLLFKRKLEEELGFLSKCFMKVSSVCDIVWQGDLNMEAMIAV